MTPIAWRSWYLVFSSISSWTSWSPTPIIWRSVVAFSLLVISINFGRSRASSSTKLSSNFWPALFPLGSITFRSLFLPLRSTIRPFDSVILRLGGIVDPSRCACEGLYLLPPKAHAIASNTLVLPWLLFPPTIVSPFADGSILTALTRFTFSISSLLIVTIS